MPVLFKTHCHWVKITLKQEGKNLSSYEKEIEEMRREIKEEGIDFNSDLSSDVQQIIRENQDNIAPSMKLLWEY